MTNKVKLLGEHIYLRTLVDTDVSKRYVGWLNDPELNRFLESRFTVWTLENLISYVTLQHQDNVFHFAICLVQEDLHIGNIKLGPINSKHLFADIGIMIGEKSCWGHGYGTEAIRLMTAFAFDQLRLKKLTAGSYSCNLASIRAFETCGFVREGRLKDHYLCGETRVDAILLGCTAADFARITGT